MAPLPSPRVGIRVKIDRAEAPSTKVQRLERAAKTDCMFNMNKWIVDLTRVE